MRRTSGSWRGMLSATTASSIHRKSRRGSDHVRGEDHLVPSADDHIA
jgi:hypothetical protein